MKDGETTTTVCIDMDRIMKEIQVENWKTCSIAHLEKCKRAVLSKIDDNTERVEMVGALPDVVAAVISAALAQRVVAFEYGPYNKPRYTIFDYSQKCPEMMV
jgi:hypothetical protein